MQFARKHAIPLIAAGLLAASNLTALAEDAASPENGPRIDKLIPFSTVITSPRNLASNIVGSAFYSMDEKKIGTVEDIVLDNDGKMIALEVGVGGFLGLDETHLAVPVGDIEFGISDGTLRISADVMEQDIRDLADS